MPALAPLLPLDQLNPARFDAPAILKRLASSSRALAELKGIAASIPNQGILINTLGLQEAKDSSEIENIVTTHDELFRMTCCPRPLPIRPPRKCCATARPCAWASSRCAPAGLAHRQPHHGDPGRTGAQ
jgi:hypothetical protein